MLTLFDRRRLALILIGACLALSARPGQATSARTVDLATLVHSSDAVVLGRAGQRESFWQGGRIYTRVQVDIEQVWKGPSTQAAHIDVILLGGVVGDIGQRVDGSAEMPAQQRFVLHLRKRPGHEYVPVALAQGVWLVADATDNAPVSRPNIDRLMGATLVNQALPTTLGQLKRAVLQAARTP